jgi:transposase-like protein
VRNVSVLAAIGVGTDGYRKVLGIAEGAKEDKTGWSAFLKHLKERGLKGVKLVISDACLGLIESITEFYPESAWQRCAVHFYRNIFSVVPHSKVREVAQMLKAIHACEDRPAAQAKANAVVEKLKAMKLPKAAHLVQSAVAETLSYYAFPSQHWRSIRTNNPLERILREIRRRTRVVGAFPDGRTHALCGKTSAHRRHPLGHQALSQHGTAQPTEPGDDCCLNESRPPLTKVRKILDATLKRGATQIRGDVASTPLTTAATSPKLHIRH